MRKQSTKTLAAIVLIIVLVFSMSTVAFAESRNANEAESYTIVGIAKSFIASSSTKAIMDLQAIASGDTPYITSKMTLQSAPLGSSNYSKVSSVPVETKTVKNQPVITHSVTFPITSDKEYRVKIQLTDEVNNVEATITRYCYLQR